MNKIAILSPYFGKLPNTISHTIESMKKNNFIDWYIITDAKNLKSDKNVKIIHKEFEEINKLSIEKMGTSICNPYKLCDYKPAYGFLFENLIYTYAYWGYCDLDIIFGDIKRFVTDDILIKYDKIFDLGHFSILKNNKKILTSFMGNTEFKVDYKKILSSKYIYVFDETYDEKHENINSILKHMNYNIYVNRNIISDINIKYRNFRPINLETGYDYYYSYDNGVLVLKRYNYPNFEEQVIYVHMQKRKNIEIMSKDLEKYYIFPKAIVNKKISDDYFYKGNQFKFIFYLKLRLKRKIANIKRNFD